MAAQLAGSDVRSVDVAPVAAPTMTVQRLRLEHAREPLEVSLEPEPVVSLGLCFTSAFALFPH